MSAYVDGELTGEEMLAIRRHLSACSDCRAEHESVLAVKKAVANLATARPRADLTAAILRRLDLVTIPKHHRLADWLIRTLNDRVSPVAAALAVSGLALIMLSAGGLDTMTSPASQTVSAQVQQVSFFRENNNVALSFGQPVQIADDIPGVGRSRFQLAAYSAPQEAIE